MYISGKITGIEKIAPILFERAESEVIHLGYEPCNPMKLDHSLHDQSWKSFMQEDIKALLDCQAIYMLHNYHDSKGALLEKEIAEKLGMDVFYQSIYNSTKNIKINLQF